MVVVATQPVAIKIDAFTKDRLKRLAEARQRTPHWLMREAITQYVDREEKREAFRQDTVQAWEAFRAAGHLRGTRERGRQQRAERDAPDAPRRAAEERAARQVVESVTERGGGIHGGARGWGDDNRAPASFQRKR